MGQKRDESDGNALLKPTKTKVRNSPDPQNERLFPHFQITCENPANKQKMVGTDMASGFRRFIGAP